MKASITERPFGVFENKPVTEYTLSNGAGMQVSVINYGATITRILTVDKYGTAGNVIIGFDSLEDYFLNANHYFGCIVGRFCNRIANGRFSLDGNEYQLALNDKKNSLHGGIKGFDKVCWDIEKREDECSLKLTYKSKDGEEGYPGNLNIEVIYFLTPENALILDYSATTDKPTPVNLTSHCYFNLSAGKNPSVLDHELELFADKYTPVDENAVPTGVLADVKNTALDFNVAKKIGQDIGHLSTGYDSNMVLNVNRDKAASLYDPGSGRCMDVYTTEPALQFYSGNFLHSAINAGSFKHAQYGGLCLEAQHFPNSPNEPRFPDTILRPGNIYRQTTVYKFSIK